ncbi:ATP-binding protein [Catellatospora vulcania]|uniref:ATP-binding protein n=1 Tax=Catellatospora vulcania TaxID=1460450 RepID=UPI0012D48CCC|nr:AAA family ATPase [Catellatospora vulcania]
MTARLIGRAHPSAVLHDEVTRAMAGHGGLVLVAGEAGIGKTSLLTAAMAQARAAGALVVAGTCWDAESAPGFWPWTQVLRAVRRGVGEDDWAAARRAGGAGLAVLLGEGGSDAGLAELDGEFPLFDAVTSAFVALSQRRPVVVVLDDLHWADAASLRLLRFAAQHTWSERVLLLGAYRDVEVEAPGHPLAALMLPLSVKATTVTLTGLGRDEVAELMARTAGSAPDPALAAEVHRRTGGNPFFVEQTARLWHSGGGVTAIAPGVRDALARRLALLPADVTALLAGAAVLGREFPRQVLVAASGNPAAEVDRLLASAEEARLVAALGTGRYGFTHDLVREALHDALPELVRQELHAAVVRAAEASPDVAGQVLPADLARHAYLAGPLLTPELAVARLLAAATDAGDRLATDEAIAHYRRALAIVREPARRVRVLVDLGRSVYHLGDKSEGWHLFEQAAELARGSGDGELLAWVALIVHRHGRDGDPHTDLRRELLRDAYRILLGDGAEAATPAQLAQSLIVRTEALARTGRDDEALMFSLWARHDLNWGPGGAREREALTAEMEEVSRRSADTGTEALAASFRWVALLEMGDPGYLEQVRAFVAAAQRDGSLRMRISLLVDQAVVDTARGRFAEAADLLAQLRTSEGHPHADFAFMQYHLEWALAVQRGRFAEADRLLAQLDAQDHPYLPLVQAITAVERGDPGEALRLVAAAEARNEHDPYPTSVTRLWLRLRAQLAAATRDPERCAKARAALIPYRGEWAVSLWGCDVSGPLDFWLAEVDAATGRWDEAVADYTAAAESSDRMQARPWAVRARAGLARALAGRDGPGDAQIAAGLRVQVAREAAELGMAQLTTTAPLETGARDRSDGAVSKPPGDADTPAADAACEFRRVDATWRLRYAGRTVHLPDAKGLRDLHELLSHPGTDIPAVELADPPGGATAAAARRMGADPVLDETAKAHYRQRLTQLDDALDLAARRDDAARRAALESERDALLAELRAAAGLGGRTRRLGDDGERARKAVTARIRDTLRRLDELHPELAAHLRATVSTGNACGYHPDTALPWRL